MDCQGKRTIGAWLLVATSSVILTLALAAPSWAELKGKVTLDGKPPELAPIDFSANPECAADHAQPVPDPSVILGPGQALKNVVVSVTAADGSHLPGKAPAQAVVIDQKGCLYSPHVVAMMIGQDLVFTDQDGWAHNVHSMSLDNPPFNFMQLHRGDRTKVDAQNKPEYFQVKCDIHPWMLGYVAVFDNPFFAITADDGTFHIEGLPDGQYVIHFWHERFTPDGPVEQKVTIKNGKGQVDCALKAEPE